MKSYLSKLGVLLFGAMFAVAACQDYDEDIRKVNDELNTELTDLTSKLDAAIAELEGKHNADIEALQSDLEDLEGKIEDAKTALTAAYTAADAALKTELEGELEEQVNAAVAQVEEVLDGIDAAYKAADAEVLADAKAYVDGKVDALNTTIEDLKAADKTNADAIAKVAADLAKAQTDLAAADAALQAQINALAADVEANEAAIAQLQKDLKEAKANLEEAIAAEKAAREAGDAKLDEAIKAEATARAAAIQALADAHAKDIADVKALIKANADAIEAEAAARAAADKDLETAYKAADEALKAELKKLIDANASAIATLQKTAADLQDQITKLDAAYKAADEQLRKDLADAIAKVETDYKAADAALEAAYKAADEALKDAYEAADAALAAEIETLNTKLNGLAVDVEKLFDRIQSVVYVPTHADGKARVEYVTVGTNPDTMEYYDIATTIVSYRVYPAEAAKMLADAFVADAENISLSYVAKTVATKANDELLEVVGATAKDGILMLQVKTNFGEKFYKGTMSYSGALVVANTETEQIFSTEYVNFVPGEAYAYKLGLQYTQPKNNKLTYTGDVETYDIKYTSDEVINVLDNVVPVFVQVGNASMALSEKEFEFAYGIVPNYGLTFEQDPKDTKVFVVANDATAEVKTTVKLAETGVLANVGETLNITHVYTAGGEEVKAYALVKVIGELVNYTVNEPLVATWAYELDAKSDAGEVATKRTFEVALDQITVDNTLANTTLKDVLASTPKITVNGTEVTTGITLAADDAKMTVVYEGFEWDETYDVVAEYTLKYATVYVRFQVNTVDRNREPITVDYGKTTALFEKALDIKQFGENNTFALQNVVDALVANGNLDANYAEDIFVKHETVVDNYSKYDAEGAVITSGASAKTCDIRYRFEDMVFSYRYYAESFTTWYPTLVYASTFTTWYGQQVTIKHTLELELPTYDFAHRSYYVTKDAAEVWYSQVTGKYTPEHPTTALEAFEVNNIELDKAFYVVDPKGEEVADYSEFGLVTDFELEGTYGAGITINDANVITYNDKDDKVDVLGKLYINVADKYLVELPTSFATTYANYYVAKYDPIGTLVATNYTQVIDNAKVYEIPVLGLFSLKDRRNFEEAYELIDAVTGTWVAGNGENGFGTGYTPTDVYGLEPDFSEVKIPAGYEEIISFENGVLSFDNTNHMGIVEDININVTFVINYTWGYRQAEVVVTFPKNIK